jgi:hypothetical protein
MYAEWAGSGRLEAGGGPQAARCKPLALIHVPFRYSL